VHKLQAAVEESQSLANYNAELAQQRALTAESEIESAELEITAGLEEISRLTTLQGEAAGREAKLTAQATHTTQQHHQSTDRMLMLWEDNAVTLEKRNLTRIRIRDLNLCVTELQQDLHLSQQNEAELQLQQKAIEAESKENHTSLIALQHATDKIATHNADLTKENTKLKHKLSNSVSSAALKQKNLQEELSAAEASALLMDADTQQKVGVVLRSFPLYLDDLHTGCDAIAR
jgi:hypothetical protein